MIYFDAPHIYFSCSSARQVMRGKNKADLKKLMSVSDNIADLNLERFKKFLGSAKVEQGPPTAELAADIARPAVRDVLQSILNNRRRCWVYHSAAGITRFRGLPSFLFGHASRAPKRAIINSTVLPSDVVLCNGK